MSKNRLEYIDQQYREVREKHDFAMKIGDFFAIRDLQNAYNHLAKEREWLHDIDHAFFFPHTWDDFEEDNFSVRVVVLWPKLSVTTPLEVREIEKGGMRFSYDFMILLNDESIDTLEMIKNELVLGFINHTGLYKIQDAIEEANQIIRWLSKDSPAYSELSKQLRKTTEEEADKSAQPWLDHAATMFTSLNFCRERATAREVWSEACRLAFRTIAQGKIVCEWDYLANDVFTVVEE